MNLKPIAILLSLIVIASFVLLVFGRINLYLFWGIMAFSAIIAYVVFPRLKEKEKQAKR